jgi:Gamma-glutamyl cyclotransferase, AIG2-like
MALLFSYGTLQRHDVQLSTFGRLLEGNPDALPGYERSLVPIDDPVVVAATGRTHHANARYNGRRDSHVEGMVLQVTDAELAAADQYEATAGYVRIEVTLESGRRTWVYVDGRSVGSSDE